MKFWDYHRYDKLAAILLLIISVIAIFFATEIFFEPTYEIYSLNDGWEISVNGVSKDTDSLLDANFGVMNNGDIIILKRTLPEFKLENPCIMMYTIHSLIDVYLDDELIYSFGHDYYERERTVPKRYNYFALGQDYLGKELRIAISGTRYHSFSGTSVVTVGERRDILTYHLRRMLSNIIIGDFLMILGLALMVLSPYMVLYHNNDLRLLFSGLISLLLGLYIYSFYGLIDLLCNNPVLNTICEYTSMYNIPTAILGYFMSISSGRLKKIFGGLFSANMLVFLSVFFFTVIGNSRIFEFSSFLQGLAFVEAVICSVIITKAAVKAFKEPDLHLISSDNVFSAGLILFMILSVVDIFRYNYSKYISHLGESSTTISFFTAGAVLLVCSLLISYLLYIIYNSNLQSMQSRISSLAFTDPLTGLANRARCEQVMDLLSQERSQYTIISLDLNKLKQVNDTLGHHEGDRLLSGFATILSDCFLDANLVGRMGGDEFIVILTEERTLNTTRRIHELYSMINDWNHKEQVFQYSASYGYAYSYEVPSGSAQEVYMLADSRMYEMKREHQMDKRKEVIKNA
ncbi:GGDEF domain-containing protein [Butyrivibrio sp. XPD2006]|uniref:GGDEF domain-containing protein n=1 Tax=Butyrivibrio sp. XPD2006 TaxID=1280668 RepID=UPI0003B373FC|nr:diguanylate cyclase [Butyrivibrio sp. XPD2006]